ncbi:MFS transporter [Serratia silvae]|uniref:MFS transporter n=1 Tax=Serratia silvae TaxID=2824122 RepID=A0ABT0KCT7_9GAMM|nr:MFS transporter [Serratia silvae]MCL1029772.1 MFS transporter [Serratia silvae]
MSFFYRMSVVILAAINPVSMDLLAPAIPYFQLSLPALDGQVFFSTYLIGLAAGQFIGAFLLNGRKNVLFALLFCIIFCAGSLLAGSSTSLQSFLISRFVTGFSAGIIYLFCMLLVANSENEEEIAESYRLRNQTLLYVATLIPFLSAAVITLASFTLLVKLQLAYGVVCFLLMTGFVRKPLKNRGIVEKKGGLTRTHFIYNVFSMMSWSAMLYFTLSLIPTLFGNNTSHPEWMICAGLATSAIFYRLGGLLKHRVKTAAGAALCFGLIITFTFCHYTSSRWVEFLMLGIVYFIAGVYQSQTAAKVLSSNLFASRRNTSLLTFINLLVSALIVELARRIGVADSLIWIGIPLVLFAISPQWKISKHLTLGLKCVR